MEDAGTDFHLNLARWAAWIERGSFDGRVSAPLVIPVSMNLGVPKCCGFVTSSGRCWELHACMGASERVCLGQTLSKDSHLDVSVFS